jgi:DNA mismatch repair protein MutS
VEYIANPKLLGAKTLFATHYHELTELEGKLESVNNYCIAVKEQGEDIIFLRKIIPGGADKSYGIQVAKLAGVPDSVLKRAYEIADQLSENDLAERAGRVKAAVENVRKTIEPQQLSLFDDQKENKEETVIFELTKLDLSHMTPMEALTKLYDLQMKLS